MENEKKMKTITGLLAVVAVISVAVCVVLMVMKYSKGNNPYPGLPEPTIVEMPEDDDWSLITVNRFYELDEEYEPDLTEIGSDTGIKVDSRVADPYIRMRDAAKEYGITLTLATGYVSKDDQKTAYEDEVKIYTDDGDDDETAQEKAAYTVLPPGRCEDNYGLSVGFAHGEDLNEFRHSNVYMWLRAHAAEFGFIERYTAEKEDITYVTARPWYWRYVGETAAQEIKEQGVSLEEYTGNTEPEEDDDKDKDKDKDKDEEKDPLTLDDASQLFEKANGLYIQWVEFGPEMDWDATAEKIDGVEFLPVVSTDFTDVDTLKAGLGKFFAPEIYEKTVDEKYRMVNGKLYSSFKGAGDVGADSFSQEIVTQSENECTFSVTAHFGGEKPSDTTNKYTMERKGDNWIFTKEFTPQFFYKYIKQPEPLTAEQAGRIAADANNLYYRWFNVGPPYVEGAKTAKVNKREFTEVTGMEYATLDELRAVLEKTFADPKIYEDVLEDDYTMVDEKLYSIVPGALGDIDWKGFEPEIVSQTENRCTLRINYYHTEYEKPDEKIYEHTDYELIYTDGCWKVNSPFTDLLHYIDFE